MPLEAFPSDTKQQFIFLVGQAEKYIQERTVGPRAFRTWRKRAHSWLKTNAPDSGLSNDLLLVPAGNMQRALRALLRAKPLVPLLNDRNGPVLPKPADAKKVFIVHGRDDGLKTTVARLVDRLGLQPIILHEQPNKGRTIIEKFLDHSQVGFAVVLLSPDDKGGLATDPPDKYLLRARQNVILELGFFLGKLGRANVAAIYSPAVEMPSDYSGVVFLPQDPSGTWQLALAKEMKSAGLPVDLNKL